MTSSKKTAPPSAKAKKVVTIPASTGLEVSERQLLLIMQRRPGELHTTDDFLKALKKPVEIFDNKAAVIGAISRMEERGKCERGWLGTGPAARFGWKVKPTEYRDPAPLAPPGKS